LAAVGVGRPRHARGVLGFVSPQNRCFQAAGHRSALPRHPRRQKEPPMKSVPQIFPADPDNVVNLQIPPHSMEAEQSVLGGLLLDNAAWDLMSDSITEDDFYRYEHRLIYTAMGVLLNAGKPADLITVRTYANKTLYLTINHYFLDLYMDLIYN
jgi:hypothetical protein